MTSAVLVGLFGAAQGFRHALEPDHVTAVATVLVRDRRPRRAIAYAAAWGVGHGAVLVGLGTALLAFRLRLSPAVESVFELFVALMLVGLGVRALASSRAESGRGQAHGHAHAHAAVEPAAGGSAAPLVRGSMAIGMVHGLAGSGAVTAVAASTTSTMHGGVACLLLYAVSCTLGMAVLAGAAGPVLAKTGQSERVGRRLVQLAGVASVVLGLVWAATSLLALARG